MHFTLFLDDGYHCHLHPFADDPAVWVGVELEVLNEFEEDDLGFEHSVKCELGEWEMSRKECIGLQESPSVEGNQERIH